MGRSYKRDVGALNQIAGNASLELGVGKGARQDSDAGLCGDFQQAFRIVGSSFGPDQNPFEVARRAGTCNVDLE